MPTAPWLVETLPDQRSPVTTFRIVRIDGRQAVRIEANASYGNLVHRLQRAPGNGWLSWQWRVDELNRAADLRSRQADDTSAKVCVMFAMALDRVPFVERQILRIARSRTGLDLPAATVCYVWDSTLAAGTRIDNAYSRRVRYLVLRSGALAEPRWVAERRDLVADFKLLFGDESPKEVPLIQAIAIGADADNTRGNSLAYIADLRLAP
ncbi:MAG: DUF3047 domain-containing protein [Ideonella sp.]